ncbi:alpha/beta hydrolase [Streptomyces poonensis]|uniref:Lipase n=1 Tax=Streptomyces poonensis TaxID=68255 RepID=A0A918UEX7_9ACTN|nr:alpha/beta hydrolase [Streptomyces poonensis]GGY98749.1 lipase [Streptomyces poonensis]
MPVYDRDTVPERVGRGTLDPELAAWLPTGPVLGADEPVADARRAHRVLGEVPLPSVGAVEHLVLDGPYGSLPVRVHTPTEAAGTPCGALVYLHGGGFTVGTLDEFELPLRIIAEGAGIKTYAVDYRRAPEFKFPTQLEENEHAVRWLFDHAGEQGVDPARIALGGDSAGGNMTCVLALRFRDGNGPALALQVPLFPETAFPADTPAASENRSGLYLESNGIFQMIRNLVRNTDDVRQPYITPLNAASHAGLPPTILVTNGFDPLRDVGHAYARALAAAGNDLTYVHHPDLTHGFPQFSHYSRACRRATEELAGLIRARLGRPASRTEG